METLEHPSVYVPRVAREMGILPALTVCEVSMGPAQSSIAHGLIGHCDRLLLIEPLLHYAIEGERVFHTKVLQVAVGMEPGRKIFIDRGECSYLKGTWAPEVPFEMPVSRTFEVEVVTFDTLDDGQIEILNLDCEGQEWAVLSKMKSRPKLLNVELRSANPYFKEINQWLFDNKYILNLTSAYETGLYHL
jgi:hypothetical protein